MTSNIKKIVTIENMGQLDALLSLDIESLNVEAVYISSDTFTENEYKDICKKLKAKNVKTGIRLSRVNTDKNIIKSFIYDKKDIQNKKLDSMKSNYDFDYIMIRNIDQFSFLLELLRHLDKNNFKFNFDEKPFNIHLDWSLNIYNNETKNIFYNLLSNLVPIKHLLCTFNLEQNIKELGALNMDDLVFYGYVPVMVSSNCLLKSQGKCMYPDRNFDSLDSIKSNENIFTSAHTTLIDRKNETLNIKTYCKYCYNQIFNPEPIFLCDMRDDLKSINYKYERYDFTFETGEDLINILEREDKPIKFTRGHIKRGIL